MDTPQKSTTSLFDVYLRLRPSNAIHAERFLDVEAAAAESCYPKHITIKPPSNDHRKRAVERFAFTRVFEEDAAQLDLFEGIGVPALIGGVLGQEGQIGRDGLLATLGVTGSGKSHTILGTKAQRGMTQMSLDMIFQGIGARMVQPACIGSVFPSIAASDVSEAQMSTAAAFLDALYGDGASERGMGSRAQTPMVDGTSFLSAPPSKKRIPRPSGLPQYPSIDVGSIQVETTCEYVVTVSMYEVYNDRIFDLLRGTASTSKPSQQSKRRALLFKSTELSPDRKVVAGLRKIVCTSLDEALMVLETGLMERKVAGTGSNAVSSRSHGFFCVEVKKRRRVLGGPWSTSNLTIVDLAGSERARNAKTAGATLAEAGKINESLMYLGQCMQMQSDQQDGSKNIVPFRQCKLTELLFSNSFPTHSGHHHQNHSPQKAIMVVTADPVGDFNATSQILRYSALAREVTVPRIPSVTSQILAGAYDRPASAGERTGSTQALEDLALASEEVARLTEELEMSSLRLAEEISRRQAAEACWQATENRMLELEQEIRDVCYEEMEKRLDTERRRWKNAWDEEADRNDEHLDQKIEILARGISIHEDPPPSADERAAELEAENEGLKQRIADLQRELLGKSPTRKQRVLKSKKWETEAGLENSSV